MKYRDMCSMMDRIRTISQALRNQNSGADIHQINNIRQTAEGLLHALEDTEVSLFKDDSEVLAMVKRAETKLIEFYQAKYPGTI